MDPNPKSFPILSYVLSRLPSFGPKAGPSSQHDVEQPHSPAPSAASPSRHLFDRMPHLGNPEVISAMTLAVSNVAQTRSVLRALGDRPDHEALDAAKAKIAEIEFRLASYPYLGEKDQDSQRQEAEKEKQAYKAVVQLDEMHEAYEKLLKDAEEKLGKIYDSATAGGINEESLEVPQEEEVSEEVVGILQEASGKGMERVDLSERQLRLLPEAFGRIPGLVVLNLASNQLQVIPDSIAGLEKLEELYLSSNLLELLPDSIGLLLNLKILDVSKNKLSALPDSISHCRSLVKLDASFNALTYLPTNIGHELLNLRTLSIQLNKIRSLPTSICEMKSLRILDVHFNELRGLPPAIGRLTKLEVLDLSSNFSDLKELPDTIGDLTNLRELDLSNNQIHALPNTSALLYNLTKLNVDQNPMAVPPEEVVREGVEAIKDFMGKRWVDVLVEEEKRRTAAADERAPTGWLSRSTSWLNDVVSGVSENVAGYLGSPRKGPTTDSYLDQQR